MIFSILPFRNIFIYRQKVFVFSTLWHTNGVDETCKHKRTRSLIYTKRTDGWMMREMLTFTSSIQRETEIECIIL